MHRANVYPQSTDLDVQRACQLTNERLRRRVTRRERRGYEPGHAAREYDASGLTFRYHPIEEVMRNGEGCRGIAFDVAQQFGQGRLIDESRDYESRVVEHASHVDVRRGIAYELEVIASRNEVATHGAEF